MLGFGYGGYRISESAGIRALAENGERQLELHARTVESEISKYTYLPSLLELERSVSHLLTDPTPYRRNQVNAYPKASTAAPAAARCTCWTPTAGSWPPATGATRTATSARTCRSAPTGRTR